MLVYYVVSECSLVLRKIFKYVRTSYTCIKEGAVFLFVGIVLDDNAEIPAHS